MTTELRGSSWNHPRGHDPMVATSLAFSQDHRPDVRITWAPRSLKDFGMTSVEELSRQFDFIVMDHPHIGTMAASGCVIALDDVLGADDIAQLAVSSPGGSHQSYRFEGRQWALAIDAACQTSVRRPDLMATVPRTWSDVVALAGDGKVLWPLCAVDAAASLMTMAASAGTPCGADQSYFLDRATGRWAVELMRAVAQVSDRRCLTDSPIEVLNVMSQSDEFLYSPLSFCYINYSSKLHTGRALTFGPIPTREASTNLHGALLGGAGLAVSAHSKNIEAALEYAIFVASPQVQRGIYLRSGGQPAHIEAWSDPAADEFAGGFFSSVLPTLNASWTRPTAPRFSEFQNHLIDHFEGWFDRSSDVDRFLDDLEVLYLKYSREHLMVTPADLRRSGE